MSSVDSEEGDVTLFPITDVIHHEDSEMDSPSEAESHRDASDEHEESDEEESVQKRQRFLSLRQRRLSRALATFEGLKVSVNRAQRNWIKAISKARHMNDPWEGFHLDDYQTEVCYRHRYHALKKAWLTDEVKVKMEKKVCLFLISDEDLGRYSPIILNKILSQVVILY